ncbi:hypothetical protein [Defluviitalea phaphyphila]|uniref:hypothetical protein n=1 Tax=Defluviitalea phaphyphila TaxID=1473580 RepID=UPI0007314FB1|nr:hypothetical protein [Defluviitalea phaphyphila]
MSYLDEEIAKIEKEFIKREETMTNFKIEELNENQEKNPPQTYSEEEDYFSEEEIKKAIEKNLLEKDNLKIIFSETSFFDGRISMKFPKDFFELKADKEGYLVYMNVEEGMNCIFNYVPGEGSIDLQKIKKNIKDGMKASKVKTKWIEEGAKKVSGHFVGYCILLNFIPNEEIFNYMIFTPVNDGHVIINFNGNKKNYNLWKLIAKELMQTIQV